MCRDAGNPTAGDKLTVTSKPITPDPLPELTDAEKKLVHKINKTWHRDMALARLKADLQAAVEVELATIPIYLFTYYSLIRNARSGNNIRPCDMFANTAGSAIMSVAVEEMLHMTLSSNILYSLGQEPQLYLRAPSPYPTGLPHHNPKGPAGPHGDRDVKIPLSKLTYDQLWHFLQIEYPETLDAEPQDSNWDTIGQFYSYIRCLICSDHIHDNDFKKGDAKRQIQDFNYSPNNIDTVHPKEPFDPWKPAKPVRDPSWSKNNPAPSASETAEFLNAEDSFAAEKGDIEATPLISVSNKVQALTAIATICDQGEGFAPTGKPDEATDDQSDHEDSHYYKFLKLQAQFAQYDDRVEELPQNPPPPPQIAPVVTEADLEPVLVNFPSNPVTAQYTEDKHILLSNFCNGLFQYMFIMTETMYRLPPDPKVQKKFFNEGLHRSMIWCLDKLIQNMRGMELKGTKPTQYLAPTFENFSLGDRSEAFANLCNLGEKVIKAFDGQGPTWIVQTAISNTNTTPDGKVHSMHLPDVSKYWK